MTVRYTLVGPNAGKTIKLGSGGSSEYSFVDGVYMFPGSPNDALLLDRIMGPFYSAYRDDALLGAQRRYEELVGGAAETEPAKIVGEAEDEAAEKAALATKAADEAAKADAEKAALAAKAADEAAKADAEKAALAAKADAEKDRLAAEKDRLAAEQAADPLADPLGEDKPKTLAEIVAQLDPTNADHWTSRGLPSMEAIETLAGKPFTREEVEAAAPGYNLTKAKAAQANG